MSFGDLRRYTVFEPVASREPRLVLCVLISDLLFDRFLFLSFYVSKI